MTKSLLALVCVALLAGCGQTSEPTAPAPNGEVPTGTRTGVVHVKVTNTGARPIYIEEECCYPGPLRLRAGAIWSYGSRFCGTAGAHNDPNVRIVTVDAGASWTGTWSGVFYERVGSEPACIQARYAEPGDYRGTFCVFLEKPMSAHERSGVTQDCRELTVKLLRSGDTTTELSFGEN